MDDRVTIKDGKERLIEYDLAPDCITARHNGKVIGDFTLDVVGQEHGPDEVHADTININEDYQRAGIGSEMVRLASEYHDQPLIPPQTHYVHRETRNTMTGGGRALMEAGQRKGWVSEFPDVAAERTREDEG